MAGSAQNTAIPTGKTSASENARAVAADAATPDSQREALYASGDEDVRVAAVSAARSDALRYRALGVAEDLVPVPAGDILSVPGEVSGSVEGVWIAGHGGPFTVGITKERQASNGDTVYVETPAPGAAVPAGAPVASLETVIAIDDVVLPVPTTIVEANDALIDTPEILDKHPQTKGWLVRVDVPVSGRLALTALIRDALAPAAMDPSPRVRAAAARTAASDKVRWAALSDPDEDVRAAALDGASQTFRDEVARSLPRDARGSRTAALQTAAQRIPLREGL